MPVCSEQAKARKPSVIKFPQVFALKSFNVIVSGREKKRKMYLMKVERGQKTVLMCNLSFLLQLDPEKV